METEEKRVGAAWGMKTTRIANILNYVDSLERIDEALVASEAALDEVGLGIGYTSKLTEIYELIDQRSILWQYISNLPIYVQEKIDRPLYEAFVNDATEGISRIRLEDFEADAAGTSLSVNQSVCYTGEGHAYPITEQKTKLTFADFLGTEVGAKTHAGNTITTTLNSVKGFSDIFSNQYEQMKEQLKDSEGKQLSYEEYLELLTHMGEFDHAMNKPLASFLSGLLDITIFKPIIEACTGTDLITKEDLSDTERALKAVFAVVDVVTLGQAIGATNIIKISSKETLKQLGRIAVVELGTNAAGYTVGALGEQLNLPVWLTLLLSMGGGAAVNQMLNEKLILANASAFGTMSPEDAGEYMKFLKEGSTEGLTQQELLGIQKVDDRIVLNGVDYDEILGLRNGIGEGGLDSGLTQSQITDIINTPKGNRPDPSSYLSQDYIDAHLAQFDDGLSVIQTEWAYGRYSEINGFVGVPDDNTLFVMPKKYCDEVIAKANGDISIIETELGFPIGYFSDGGGLVRIDVEDVTG